MKLALNALNKIPEDVEFGFKYKDARFGLRSPGLQQNQGAGCIVDVCVSGLSLPVSGVRNLSARPRISV